MSHTEELLKILEDTTRFLQELSIVEEEKFQAAMKNHILTLEECIKKEQALVLRSKGLDLKRTAVQKAMGAETLTLKQIICFVVTTPCPTLLSCPACSGQSHDIRFERTEEPDITAQYLRLCVTEIVTPESGGEPYPVYRPLVSRNDEYFYVHRDEAENLQEAINNALNNH